MTRRTQGDQIFRPVGPALQTRNDVMNLQIARMAAAWPLAPMPVPRQDEPFGLGWNGGCVAFSWLADLRIAEHVIMFGW